MAKVAKGGNSDNPQTQKTETVGRGAIILDTLAQLGKPTETKVSPSHNTFLKRARRKDISKAITGRLLELNSPLSKGYRSAYYCIDTLLQEGNHIRSRYCKQRWCAVCSNIRTADAINGYKNAIQAIGRTYLFTLTFRSVKAEDLPQAIKTLSKAFRKITHDIIGKKYKLKFKGVRKIECGYNADADTYNPHIHFLCATDRPCELLLLKSEWLQYFPNTTDPDAQDIRPADDNTFLETFKYTSKPIIKGQFSPHAQDIIYQSLRNVRTLQPIGIKKQKDKKVAELSQEIDFQVKRNEIWTFVPYAHDWVSASGEVFTGYIPDDKVKTILDTINNS